MCLVDGNKSIAMQIIAKVQELLHFNSLWCHVFHVLSYAQGMTFLQISLSKILTITVHRLHILLHHRLYLLTPCQPPPFTSIIIIIMLVYSRALQHETAPPTCRPTPRR